MSLIGTADELIERATARLQERRAHAERVLKAGGDVEGAHAVVHRLENAISVLKLYKEACERGGLMRRWPTRKKRARKKKQ